SLSRKAMLLLCAPVLINGVAAGLTGGLQNTPLFTGLFYLNLAFQSLAVAGMALRSTPAQSIDKLLGDLSYPIFLCHWLVAYVLAMLFFHGQSRGFGLMFATLAGATAVAYLVCRLQDRLIEPLRSRVRAGARDTTPAPRVGVAVSGT